MTVPDWLDLCAQLARKGEAMTDSEKAAHASAVAAVRKQDELRRQPEPDLLEQTDGAQVQA